MLPPDSPSAPERASPGLPTSAHFDAPRCHNCGAWQVRRYCADCGQQKAGRLGLRAVGSEAWQRWRWFELDMLRAAWRLLTGPGVVARDYVLGARKRHVHPLKLLLFAIGTLLLVLARSNYLDSADAELGRAMALVQAWSNWSFSLGIVAIAASSLLLFGRRGYNLTEHMVLAVYAQFLVICASIVTKLPVLVWRSSEFLSLHKAWAPRGMEGIGVVIVMVAFHQFFRLDLRRDAWRLLLAASLFLAIKTLLLRLYALAIVRVVLAQAG